VVVDQGAAYSVGCNVSGQLGLGNRSPTPVTTSAKVRMSRLQVDIHSPWIPSA